jgi:hypothetical protein
MSWLSAGTADVPRHNEWLDDALVGRLAAMRDPRRRTETRLGRWVVKTAVAASTDLDADDPATLRHIVVRDSPGAPTEVYVDGERLELGVAVTGSPGWAVCVVANRDLRGGCSVDVVPAPGAPLPTDELTESVTDLVAAAGPDAALVACLATSARHSALDALRLGRQRPYLVEVDLGDDVTAAWGQFTVRQIGGTLCSGWWRRFDRLILTIVADAPFRPPRSLVRPPALAAITADPPAGTHLGRVG